MPSPKVWDLWEKSKNYYSTLLNLILISFTFSSILSITHPHLLPVHVLWFLDDVYYYYLIQASISIGTNLSFLIEIIPNFPSNLPSQENKEFFYFVIIHIIPGFRELAYLYHRLDTLVPRLIIKIIRGSIFK